MLPVLFDEMYDDKDTELQKLGYEAYSVKKLIRKGWQLKTDYSIIKYADINRMILVTEEGDNFKGCKENNIPCLLLDQNPDIKLIEKKLKKFSKLR